MLARVTLATGAVTDAILVPKDALVLGGPQPMIWLVDPKTVSTADGGMRLGKAVAANVQLGVADGDLIQVIGPIPTGSLVVVKGNERIIRSRTGEPSDVTWVATADQSNGSSSENRRGRRTVMSLIEFFVKNPAKVSVGVLLLVLFGWVAFTRMPMQLTPEVQTPTITVETRWPGASPQEVEQEIVIEQEEQLKGVEGVTKMSSESTDSAGRIIIEFLVGTDMQKAVVDVIGRLEQVREYPVDADKPVISTANANDRPIAWFILSARAAVE